MRRSIRRCRQLPRSTAVREGAHDGASAAGIAAGEIEIAQPVAEPPRDGWALIALVPYDGQEPPATVSDELAMGVWCAVSALWHPSLLAQCRRAAADRIGRFPVATRRAARSG